MQYEQSNEEGECDLWHAHEDFRIFIRWVRLMENLGGIYFDFFKEKETV